MKTELLKLTKNELADMVIALEGQLRKKNIANTSIPLEEGLQTVDASKIYKDRLQITNGGQFNEKLNPER